MLIRIAVGVTLALFFLAVLYFGGVVQCIAFSLATFLCAYELINALKQKGIKPFSIPVYIFSISYYAVFKYIGMYWMLLLFICCVTAIICERIFSKSRNTADALAGLVMFIYPLAFFVFIAATDSLDYNIIARINALEQDNVFYVQTVMNARISRVALLSMFACPLVGDTCAYFIGMLFGKKKLCPEISPKKTIAGSIGGAIGGVLGGLGVYYAQLLWDVHEGLIPLLLLGLLCGLLGQIGDLFASSIKRYAGIKDFGSIFPGHGGMLDRVDSVLICAPMVFMFFYKLNSIISGVFF